MHVINNWRHIYTIHSDVNMHLCPELEAERLDVPSAGDFEIGCDVVFYSV
jgi:hypothetical protein